jgi:hypothetical protein
MNGVQIPIGRNWTPAQLVTILFVVSYFLELLFNSNFRFSAPIRFLFAGVFLIGCTFASIVFMPHINETKVIPTRFTLDDYGKLSVWYLFWLVQNLVTSLIVYNEIIKQNNLGKVLKWVIYSSVFYAIYGLYQYLATFLLGEGSAAIVYVLKGEYLWGPEAIRIASLEREPLYYSFFQLVVILMVLSSLKSKIFFIPKKHLIYILLLNLFVFTLSRPTAGFIALVVGLLYLFRDVFVIKRNVNIKSAMSNMLILLVSALGMLAFFIFNSGRILRRISDMSNIEGGYVRVRSILEGIQNFLEYPRFGVGIGNSLYFVSTEVVHNMYIQTLLETGVQGLLAVFVLIFIIYKSSCGISEKFLRDSFIAYLITILIQWLSFFNFNIPSVWFFFGLILSTNSILKEKILTK